MTNQPDTTPKKILEVEERKGQGLSSQDQVIAS